MEINKLGSMALAAHTIKIAEDKEPKGCISSFYDDQPMSTIYNSGGIEFAWVSKMGNQCIPFASCRDYLQGTAWSAYNKIERKTHSLLFIPESFPKIDLKNIRIAVRYKGKSDYDFKRECSNSLSLINEIEKEMGISTSCLLYGGKYKDSSKKEEIKDDTWVFKGDKTWMRSIYHISMYSLLIRAGTNYKEGEWRKYLLGPETNFASKRDRGYFVEAIRGINKIVEDKENTIFAKKAKDNFPPDIHFAYMDNEGIVQFSLNRVNNKFKVNWQDKGFKFKV